MARRGGNSAAFSIQTIARNRDWSDDFTLLEVTLKQSPDSGYLHNLMAGAWVQRDQIPEGARRTETSGPLRPRILGLPQEPRQHLARHRPRGRRARIRRRHRHTAATRRRALRSRPRVSGHGRFLKSRGRISPHARHRPWIPRRRRCARETAAAALDRRHRGLPEAHRSRRSPPRSAGIPARPSTPCACSAERMPTIAAVTAGCRSTQAIADFARRASVALADFLHQRPASPDSASDSAPETPAPCAGNRRRGTRSRARASSCPSAGPISSANTQSRRCCGCWQYGRISVSTSGETAEYGGCSEVIGAIGRIRSICCALKFDTPIQRTLPSCFSLANSPQPSSISSSGCGQWIW